ncbi:hypothetical protein AB1N83_013388 [Pleurotus pulmonarius]
MTFGAPGRVAVQSSFPGGGKGRALNPID